MGTDRKTGWPKVRQMRTGSWFLLGDEPCMAGEVVRGEDYRRCYVWRGGSLVAVSLNKTHRYQPVEVRVRLLTTPRRGVEWVDAGGTL